MTMLRILHVDGAVSVLTSEETSAGFPASSVLPVAGSAKTIVSSEDILQG